MPDINIGHLLDRASRTGAGAGRPRQADLRRGVSDAYYALFHGLTASIAAQTLRNVPSTAVRAFRRNLGHSALRERCARIASGKKLPSPKLLASTAAADANARLVAQAFVDLQEERHLADYAHDETFDLVRLNDAIAVASRAIKTINGHSNDQGMAALLSSLAMISTWAEDGT